MSTSGYDRELVDAVADAAGLAGRARLSFTNVAASWAMDDRPLTRDELRSGAEIAAGRLDAGDYIASLLRPARDGPEVR